MNRFTAALTAFTLFVHRLERRLLAGHVEPPPRHDFDREILRLAAQRDGRITAEDVASGVGISPAEAKRALNDLLLRQHADPELTDTGVMVYHFYDVRHLESKRTLRR